MWRGDRWTGLVSVAGAAGSPGGAVALAGQAQERKKGTGRPRQGLGGWGGGGEILTFVLVRLALALARRGGLTASAIDPAAAPSPFVCVKTLRFPPPARFRPPGLARDRISTNPGEGAVAQGRYGPQRRTNHSKEAWFPPSPLQEVATPPSAQAPPPARGSARAGAALTQPPTGGAALACGLPPGRKSRLTPARTQCGPQVPWHTSPPPA